MSSWRQHIVLQNLYVLFSINGAITEVQVTFAKGTDTTPYHDRPWLLDLLLVTVWMMTLIDEWRFLMQCRLRDQRSRLFSLGLRPCPLRTEIPPDSLNLLIMLCTVEGEISKSLPIFLWGTLFLNISIIFSRICWQTGDPQPIFAPKGLDLSWMLLLYQIIITITCWHQLFQITSLFNQFTSLLALNCSCPNFFWNVLQVWMTGKDVYLQMTWSWPDKTWNILCSYCLQWNTSQSKFRNHYFLFLFAFSILSQLFLIWVYNRNVHLHNWGQCDTHLYVQPTIRYIQDTYVWSSYRCGAIPITVQCESISIRFNTMWFNAIQCNGGKKKCYLIQYGTQGSRLRLKQF